MTGWFIKAATVTVARTKANAERAETTHGRGRQPAAGTTDRATRRPTACQPKVLAAAAMFSLLILGASAVPANAQLTFVSERASLVISSVRGSGSDDDPVVLSGTVVSDGEIVIAINGMAEGLGNRARSNHFTSFELVLSLTNGTLRPWTDFSLALEEQPGLGSDYLDGLSFGQDALGTPTRAASDRFARAQVTNEPRDGITFSIGAVGPGESVMLRFMVTDNTPNNRVYLVQYRDVPVAGLAASPALAFDAWPLAEPRRGPRRPDLPATHLYGMVPAQNS